MIRLVKNTLEGMYATPKDHPVTCANPAPWKITEMKIESSRDRSHDIWIRGDNSMWFRADQCYIDDHRITEVHQAELGGEGG